MSSVSRPSAFHALYTKLIEVTGYTPRGNERTKSARCPAHEDNSPSLSITRGNDRVLVKCQAGCDTDEVLAALGMTRADLFDEPRQREQAPAVVAEYEYTDESGVLLFVVERRFPPKTFRQKRKDATGKWVFKLGDVRRVLYRLPKVVEAVKKGQTVYVVEGEKDVHTLEKAGVTATCNPGGAGKWRDEFSASLARANVVVISDADKPGRPHAAAVVESLRRAGATVRLTEPKEGKDATDHIAAGHSLADLVDVRADLTVIDGGETASTPGQDEIKFIDWKELFTRPIAEPDWLAEPILARGRITTLYSPGKAGKSLLAMEIAAGLATGMPILGGQPRDAMNVLYIDQEMTPEDWLDRLTSMDYRADDVDQFAAHLHVASLSGWAPMDTLAGGVQVQGAVDRVKAEVVIIDTASKVIAGKENENDTHQAFYRYTLKPLKSHGLAVLVLDHTGKDIERGARGGSAKTDNVDLAWQMLKVTENTLTMRNSHARFRIEEDDKFLSVRRTTDPLRHVIEAEEAKTVRLRDRCLQAIRKLGPAHDESFNEVADQIKSHHPKGKGYNRSTLLEAWHVYRQEKGWEFDR